MWLVTNPQLFCADNVDYDEIKHLIKEHTTPGSGKALAIPGQEDIAGQGFEDLLNDELVEQHARVNLFIRSKSGEIERRLGRTRTTS